MTGSCGDFSALYTHKKSNICAINCGEPSPDAPIAHGCIGEERDHVGDRMGQVLRVEIIVY